MSARAMPRPGRPTDGRPDGQLSEELSAGLGGRSAGTEWFAGELRGLEDLDRRWVPGRGRRPHDGERRGDGRVNPPGEDVPDVPGIIGVAIEVLGGRLEGRIQGGPHDADAEHEKEDDPEDRAG